MSSFSEVLVALPSFRNHLLRQQHMQSSSTQAAFSTRGAYSAVATPASNTHATGIGIRQRGGKYIPDEFVLKLFVFDKAPADTPGLVPVQSFEGMPVDVEQLPIQRTRQAVAAVDFLSAVASFGFNGALPQTGPSSPQERFDHIVGGISISPLGASFIGTLGCFLERRTPESRQLFALSNNHVLADVNRLPVGTEIVQPGPESGATSDQDVFAALNTFIPINFPNGDGEPVLNRFDAAIANVTDTARVQTGSIFGSLPYQPARVIPPRAGMRVAKAGRTTGVTHGTITATHVQGIQINYGEPEAPRITVFGDVIRIVGDLGEPFSRPGDSGSVILEEASGSPVALLFAGDNQSTTACELGPLCQRLRAWPV